ncbi:MAG: DUF134 domain-containing protein [Geobacteraceae bacterium]|nr:DUF134 domain-containing protein [Geobacteraceae bacterium]
MSPRCKKARICTCPFRGGDTGVVFKPAGIPLRDLEHAKLDHDEMEAMYLCDYQGLTQEEAGERMGVSRGTVQRMLAAARSKVIEALVMGKAITVESGGSKGN